MVAVIERCVLAVVEMECSREARPAVLEKSADMGEKWFDYRAESLYDCLYVGDRS